MTFSELPALGFSEISNRDEFGANYSASVGEALHGVHRCLCRLFLRKFYPEVSNHVVSDIVSNDHVLDFSILGKLHKDLLVEVFEVVYRLNQGFFRHIHTVCFGDCSRWIFVQMLENHGLRQGRLVVLSSAGVSMTA